MWGVPLNLSNLGSTYKKAALDGLLWMHWVMDYWLCCSFIPFLLEAAAVLATFVHPNHI